MDNTPAAVVFMQTAGGSHPGLPRSGACGAPLPAGHAADAFVFGGYTEHKAADGSVVREPSNDAYLFTAGTDGGSWIRLEYAAGSEVPAPRLVAQCCTVGDSLWLIGEQQAWGSFLGASPALMKQQAMQGQRGRRCLVLVGQCMHSKAAFAHVHPSSANPP